LEETLSDNILDGLHPHARVKIKMDVNFGKLPVENLAHDSGRILVRSEYGYLKGIPITNS
jgi:hypothetical protein